MREFILAITAAGVMALPAIAQELRIEPASVEALRRMGDYLAGLQAFELSSATELEVVLDTDQKLLIGGTVHYLVRRPDRLRIDLVTDVVNRQFYYDGRTASYVAPEEGFYAQVDGVPGTIKEMLEQAAQTYSLTFPLADLFAWGTPEAPVDKLREGFHVGRAEIGGVAAEHWAYRGEDQDWEIWIRAEGDPLPLRISSVDRDELTRPRFLATLDWTVPAAVNEADFTYVPAAGATHIPLTVSTEEEDKP